MHSCGNRGGPHLNACIRGVRGTKFEKKSPLSLPRTATMASARSVFEGPEALLDLGCSMFGLFEDVDALAKDKYVREFIKKQASSLEAATRHRAAKKDFEVVACIGEGEYGAVSAVVCMRVCVCLCGCVSDRGGV